LNNLRTKEEMMQGAKPYDIDKRVVYEAFMKVKSNGGSAGIDGITMDIITRETSNPIFTNSGTV
jgi:hypothetical protein